MLPRQTIQARRPTGGARVSGKWIPGAPVALPAVKSTIQVASPNVLQVLPEGRRTGQEWVLHFKVFLNSELEGDEEPDELFIEGEWCIIISRGSWQNGLRPHYRYIIERKTVK